MSPREILLVTGGAFLLTNASIVGTLLWSGYFAGEPETHLETRADALAEGPPLPAPDESAPLSLADAMYLCEDRLNNDHAQLYLSYQFDYNASRFLEEEQRFRIFIETQTASFEAAPQQTEEITCDVSLAERRVVSFRSRTK